MKIRIGILFTIFISNVLFGQQWEELAPCPKKLDHNTGFRIDDYIFVGLGYDSIYAGNIIDNFFRYDILNDEWTEISSFPGGPRINAVSFVINDKAYVGFGSYTGGICFNDLWEYTPQTDSWLPMASCPNTSCVSFGPGAFSANGKGYIVTSVNSTESENKVFEFSPQINTWTQKQNFIGPKRYYASCTSDGIFGYYGMGKDVGVTERDDIWRYDTQADTWTQLTQNPISPDFWVGSVIKNEKIYFIGGNSNLSNRFDVYDLIANSWSALPTLPYATHYPLVFSHGCYIYMCSGYSSFNSNGNTDKLFRFKVENDCALNVAETAISNSKILIKIVDPLGRDTDDKFNTLLIYIFSDGTKERVYKIE